MERKLLVDRFHQSLLGEYTKHHRGSERSHLSEYIGGVIATFRVTRLSLQTRKLWLVGVATDRDASVTLACVSFHFIVSCFFFLLAFLHIFLSFLKKKRKNQKRGLWEAGRLKHLKKKEMLQEIVQQVRPKKIELKKIKRIKKSKQNHKKEKK